MANIGSCSKPSVPNAWAKGSTNPVTQRPAGAVVANGVTNNQNRSDSAQKSPSDNKKESNTPDRHANDRMTFLLANLIVSIHFLSDYHSRSNVL